MRGSIDPYRELGIPRGATDDQIKAAHRRLAKRYHPDAGEADPVRFLAVQEAYLLLSDPLRRRDWDARHAPGPVRATARPKPARPAGRPAPPSPRPPVAPQPQTTYTHETPPAGPTATGRDPAARTGTWSAQGVPWWEDFRPGSPAPPGSGARGPGAPGPETRRPPTAGPTQGAPGPAEPPITGTGFSRRPRVSDTGRAGPTPASQGPGVGDIYARSSGAAWSSAARRHFRKDDADLPRGGAFRYRGTQVVTGGEARRDADAEARRAATQRPGTPGTQRPGTPGTQGAAAVPGRPVPPPRAAGPRPTGQSVATTTSGAGLVSRLRRLLGGGSR